MSAEKPLNARVAEALGFKLARRWDGVTYAINDAPEGALYCLGDGGPIPPWGEESSDGWYWTGPLMAKYGLGVCNDLPVGKRAATAHASTSPGACSEWCPCPGLGRFKASRDFDPCCAEASGPCEAIALLIIGLAECGKLPK